MFQSFARYCACPANSLYRIDAVLQENIVLIDDTLLSQPAIIPQIHLYFRRMSDTNNTISSIETLLSEYKRIFVDIIKEAPSEPQKVMKIVIEENKLLIDTLDEEISDIDEILKCRKECTVKPDPLSQIYRT